MKEKTWWNRWFSICYNRNTFGRINYSKFVRVLRDLIRWWQSCWASPADQWVPARCRSSPGDGPGERTPLKQVPGVGLCWRCSLCVQPLMEKQLRHSRSWWLWKLMSLLQFMKNTFVRSRGMSWEVMSLKDWALINEALWITNRLWKVNKIPVKIVIVRSKNGII